MYGLRLSYSVRYDFKRQYEGRIHLPADGFTAPRSLTYIYSQKKHAL